MSRDNRNQETADRIDRLVNLDVAGRGIEHLYAAAREKVGHPLSLTAAERLAVLPAGSTVLLMTGSASRAWISPDIIESDGPAGTAVLARALSLGLELIPVIVAEEALLPAMRGIFQAAGLSIVTLDQARRASLPGGRLLVAVERGYPADATPDHAAALLDEIQPSLVFASERPGRNALGIYHNARGVDYGAGKAPLDDVFMEASKRGIPSLAVGDGGNELGMGLIAEAVARHVAYGDQCRCGCGGGIGAAVPADVLVTAAVSNWGCYAITACLALLLDNSELLHTGELEEALLRRGVDLGLINSPLGRVDADVDAIPLSCHRGIVDLIHELTIRGMRH